MNKEELSYIKETLVKFNPVFAKLNGDDFFTAGHYFTTFDGMGMLHSYSIHSFKTLDGLAEFIHGVIEDDFSIEDNKPLNDTSVQEWFKDNFIDGEEEGKWTAYIDAFTEGEGTLGKFQYILDNGDNDEISEAYNKLKDNQDLENMYELRGWLENRDSSLLENPDIITVAYVHTSEDYAGMITAGGYSNFKTSDDAAEYIYGLYKEDTDIGDGEYDEDLFDWLEDHISFDADKPGMEAVYVRSFED